MHRFPHLQRAFTLIELIVVVIVLGILMGIAIPSFLGASNGAKTASGKANVMLAYKAAKLAAAGDFNAITPGSALDQTILTSEPELTGSKAVDVERATTDVAGVPDLLTFTNTDSGVVGTLHADGSFSFGDAAATSPSGGDPGPFTLANQPSGYVYNHEQGDNPTLPYTADADGSNPRPLLNIPAGGAASVVQVVGDKLLISVGSESGDYANLGVISRTGGLQMLTTDGQAMQALLSPDGATLAFTNMSNQLFLVSSDGGTPTAVTTSFAVTSLWWAGSSHLVTYTPDGKLLLFDLNGDIVQVLGDYSSTIGNGFAYPQFISGSGSSSNFCWLQSDNRDRTNGSGHFANERLDCVDGSNWAAAPTELLASGDAVDAGMLTLSPDGSEVVYQGMSADLSRHSLWMLPTDGFSAAPVELGGPGGIDVSNQMAWAGAHAVVAGTTADPHVVYRIPDSGAAGTRLNPGDGTDSDYGPIWLGW
jgi:type IV pilus assembly protein PilA